MKTWPLVLIALTVACGNRGGSAVDATSAEAIAAGETAYQANGCAACHGPEGRGDGRLAASLEPRPRDFTDASAFIADRSIDAIARVIANGVPSRPTPMPAFGHLDEATRRQLAAWVLSRATNGSRSETETQEP